MNENFDLENMRQQMTTLKNKLYQQEIVNDRLIRRSMRNEVNDLFQEVLVNLWKGFESFEHRSDIRTWIYRVALNTCISLDRKKRRAAEVRLTMDINLFEDRDEDTRQVDMLHKRISKLQPFDRAIVLLWLENLSYEEIGQIVGISTKNVSIRLFRIREQLKQMSND